jgi:hypothetical protein
MPAASCHVTTASAVDEREYIGCHRKRTVWESVVGEDMPFNAEEVERKA